MTPARISWQALLRHGVQVLAFCCAIAAVTTLIWPSKSYWNQLVYASLIGVCSWLFIEVIRHLVPEPYRHQAREGSPGWPRGKLGLAVAIAGVVFGYAVGDTVARLVLDRPVDTGRDLMLSLLCTAVAGTVVSYYFHARGKAAALLAEKAESQRDAREAQLKLLETQLEPHMLFNTLANLRVLITLDPPRAIAMLDRLNDYLRATLAGSRATQHPLSTEFERLADYLALMQVRMGERLRYTLDLPAELRDVPVPPLLLQPLVENAIRHGLEPKLEGGAIVVSARCETTAQGRQLVLEVADTGTGLRTDEAPADTHRVDRVDGGFGVQQVRERLRTLHGEHSDLQLLSAESGGTRAIATLPLGC